MVDGNGKFPEAYNGKSGNRLFFRKNCRHLNFVFTEMLLE